MDTSINSPPLPVHDIFLNPDNDQDQFFKRAPLARLRSSIAQSCHYGSPAEAYDAQEFKPRTVWVLAAGQRGQLHSLVDMFAIEWRQ